ncbi:MAG TPA: inositol monophosphatase family protein, partial [Steroidobacteraceae bacterium]
MPSRELSAALEAARAAAEVIQASYRRNLAVTLKADRSPVTAADVEAERVIRAVLSAQFPDYGFYGEETGQHAMEAGNVWL